MKPEGFKIYISAFLALISLLFLVFLFSYPLSEFVFNTGSEDVATTVTENPADELTAEKDTHIHTPVVSKPAVPAGPDTIGYSEEISCSVCNKLLSSSIPVPATAYNSSSLYSSDYYFRNLDNFENRKNMKELYTELEIASSDYHNAGEDKTVELKYSGTFADFLKRNGIDDTDKYSPAFVLSYDGLTYEEMLISWYSFVYDHPLYYWIARRICYYSYGGSYYILVLAISEYSTAETRKNLNATIYNLVEEIHICSSEFNSVYSKVRYVHDTICKGLEYRNNNTDDNNESAHSILSFFAGNTAVCEGYTKTFQLFMNFLNIESIQVSNSNHTWNLVNFGTGWYWVDVTWDDVNDSVNYFYFCKNDTEDIWAGTGYKRPDAYKDNTFLGADDHSLLSPGGPDTVYEGKTYKELGIYFIAAIPDRTSQVYSGPVD